MDELDDTSNDLFINDKDYDFFKSLPDDEKILCLFDIWYSGEPVEIYDSTEDDIQSMINSSIQSEDTANVLITNDILVINSNDSKVLSEAVSNFFKVGLILERLFISEAGLLTYKRQKYCRIYSIIGPSLPIIYN